MVLSSLLTPYFVNVAWKEFGSHKHGHDYRIINHTYIFDILIVLGSLSNSVGKILFGSLMSRFSFKSIFIIQQI